MIIGFGMKLAAKAHIVFCAFLVLCLVLAGQLSAQELAKRLILTDGSYQMATKWEVKGDRVRYFSAERGEWEEVPNSMVDWAATKKYQQDRENGVPIPGAADLDKELAAEQKAEEAKTPEVAPGLRLPQDGGVLLLDDFQNQPQLVELQQNGSDINPDRKGNILRAAINPVASAKQNIEIAGAHAKVQAHVSVPSVYIRISADASDAAGGSEAGSDRFRIVKMQSKQGKRIVGDIKIAIFGKVQQEQKLVATTAVELSGGWVKITPTEPLDPGEYAVVEMLGKDGMNSYVWDFGMNPSAAANAGALKPEISASGASQPGPEQKSPPQP